MPVEYRVLIQKTRRKKTIGFQVMPDGVVRVSIPKHYSADHVPTLLARKKPLKTLNMDFKVIFVELIYS